MAKYKNYDYSQSLLIPASLEDQLMPGTLEFAIHTLVETRMDMSVFDENYKNNDTGRSAYDPKVLLKVVLLGYSSGLISSRKIEQACCENVTFMAISFNQRPDHSTIAAFVSSMIEGSKENLQKIGKPADYFKGKILAADTNYHSHSNLKKSQEEELDAYIPDIYFRKRDSRFATQTRGQVKKEKKFVLEDFTYNEAEDQYICPDGKILRLNIKRHIHDRNIYRRYMADAKDCKRCSLKSRCFYRKNTKRRSLDVPIGAEETNLSKAMLEKIDSEKGRKI